MKSRDFCFWLQGFFELTGSNVEITPAQADTIKTHLALVFQHEIDPSMGSKKHQDELNETHHGLKHIPGSSNNFVMRC